MIQSDSPFRSGTNEEKTEPHVALVLIYNHQFNDNIEKLEAIYGPRFDQIYHLVPFYEGDRPNVIPVYENSHYFQGYIAQAFASIFSENHDHYLFVADDLLLNPVINQENYKSHFGLKESGNFITAFIELHQNKNFWSQTKRAYDWKPQVKGLELAKLIPSYVSAKAQLEKKGLEIGPLQKWQLDKAVSRDTETDETYELNYPLVGGYSDILVVDRATIRKFSSLCGIFAAAELFVEFAIPTALALSSSCSSAIKTGKENTLKGKALWSTADIQELDVFKNSLSDLIANFPSERLFLHPIKLSKWTFDL